jgi:hypothetical protein
LVRARIALPDIATDIRIFRPRMPLGAVAERFWSSVGA